MLRLHRVLLWYFHLIGWSRIKMPGILAHFPPSTSTYPMIVIPHQFASRFSIPRGDFCLSSIRFPRFGGTKKLMAVIEFKIEELCMFCEFCIIKWKPWMDIQLLDTTSWRERFFESNLCQSMPGGMRVLVFSPVKQTTSVRLKPSEPWGVRR